MDKLPDELLLHIFAFLDPVSLCPLALVSTRFLGLARDTELWKQLCFTHSAAEQRRRHSQTTDGLRAADAICSLETPVAADAVQTYQARLANWDPGYVGGTVDWYREFVERHALVQLQWFEHAGGDDQGDDGSEEHTGRQAATGAGILFDACGQAEKLVAPLEDGSVRIWDACAFSDTCGRHFARSEPGLLSHHEGRKEHNRGIMTDTEAVDGVSLDQMLRRGYFAVRNILHEVDLDTLQLISQTAFSSPITALSEAQHGTPMTIGTAQSLHLHDPRSHSNDSSRAALAQSGTLSILHQPLGEIWVAGRFTSLLQLDRRFFPRLRNTLHSGARISSLTALPFPVAQRSHNPPSPQSIASTIVAAGEYNGKGSLELYTTSPRVVGTIPSPPSQYYSAHRNRQSASRCKLLAAAAHGSRIVCADADGVMKWFERDAQTAVRKVDINTLADGAVSQHRLAPHLHYEHSASPARRDDFVKKILNTTNSSPFVRASTTTRDNLVFWTADGKLGALGFGSLPLSGCDVWSDAEEWVDEEEIRIKEKERQFSADMRRALEVHTKELKWLRGYGLGG